MNGETQAPREARAALRAIYSVALAKAAAERARLSQGAEANKEGAETFRNKEEGPDARTRTEPMIEGMTCDL